MTAKEYILDELGNLVRSFPKVRVRYEHDRMAEVHVIEVVPNEVYHLDSAYLEWEEAVTDRFIDLFPTENVCFVSDDALVGIRNAEYISEGLAFAPISVSSPEAAMVSKVIITVNESRESKQINDLTFIEQTGRDVSWNCLIPSSISYQLAA